MKHSEEHYKLYFGKKADYYFDIVTELDSGKRVVFNLFSFLFGLFWMLYRKLYLPLLIVVILIFLESMIEQTILISINASPVTEAVVEKISLFIWVSLLGFFGNTMYINQANRKITKILALNLTIEETDRKIKKAGGTTLIPHLIIAAIIAAFIYLGQKEYFEY